jgi:hypothetical protein
MSCEESVNGSGQDAGEYAKLPNSLDSNDNSLIVTYSSTLVLYLMVIHADEWDLQKNYEFCLKRVN